MKNTLKFILLLAGALALAVPVIRAEEPAATSPGRPEHRGPGERGDPGARLERAVKDLGLTAEQTAKWKELDQQQQAAMETIRNDGTLSREAKRAKSMESMKSFGDQRRALLDAEQQKKFDDLRARMRERGPGGFEGRGGRDRQGPPPEPPPGKP